MTTQAQIAPTLNAAWSYQLGNIMSQGLEVSPRGMLTKELQQQTLVFDMRWPVVTFAERKMGYRFMAAEAWWILAGRDDVATIAPYSKAISQFSDNGETFFGAYGPSVVKQMDYVVRTLINDIDTRQALMTLWHQCPPKTKDVPCTIALDFKIRNGKLNLHVFMRSSDNWLGVPYDAFNFTMIACEVLRRYNIAMKDRQTVMLGACFFTAASAHLYEKNFADATQVAARAEREQPPMCAPVPPYLYGIFISRPEDYYATERYLEILKDVESDHSKFRWWTRPA